MIDLIFKAEVFKLVGICMEVHRELGKGHNEVVYKDAFVVELQRQGISFEREKKYEVIYKGVILPHFYFADFVIWDKILIEGKAVEKIVDAHTRQAMNYLAVARLELCLIANFGGDSL